MIAALGRLLALALAASAAVPLDPLLSALNSELQRSFSGLKSAEKSPLYFLSYQVQDVETYDLDFLLGALRSEDRRRWRMLDVDARIGDRHFDSTHQIKGEQGQAESFETVRTELPVDNDIPALRAQIWQRTDQAYKEAFSRYTRVRTNRGVTAEEEDTSDDFSKEKPSAHYERAVMPPFDPTAWKDRLRAVSGKLKEYPFIYDSYASFSIRVENRYAVNSEGSSVVAGNRYIRLSYHLASRTEDGMDLSRYQSYDSDRLEDLPSRDTVLKDLEASALELKNLLAAPVTEPFTGPAIIRNKATGVYFHEILGHRLEGHRQKIEEEGQTFAKMLGKPVTADFISVHDDPTLDSFSKQFLRGFYRFDDEAVPSSRVALIENGVLKNFLLSRMPIRQFSHSNGHGRRSSGHQIVPRMGNLIVSASRAVPFAALRQMLIEEIRRQKKPYGLLFEDIEGGYTATTRNEPQSFKVIPLLVYRVYPDGRPDEAVRGVDIVGTPLTSFSKILAAASDADVFNGTCGAESGWVPVSAVAPSVLISELEVEKKPKSSEKPPILPLPFHDRRLAGAAQ